MCPSWPGCATSAEPRLTSILGFWNDKKWRVLLFLSNEKELIMAGRQYPFTSDFGLSFILKQVLPQTHILSNAR